MNSCILSEKDGIYGWCEQHNRFHTGKHLSFATGQDPLSLSFRRIWDSASEQSVTQLRSIHDSLRCESLVDNEGLCMTQERQCSLKGTTTLIRCNHCKEFRGKPVTEDELLCLGLR